MRNIRASEIGSFLYCQRAWWYQARGLPSENQMEMAAGSDYHMEHGRKVVIARFMRAAGWIVLLGGVVAFGVGLALIWVK
jgi:CRISPR/Cas system-associated exonuclease Cas4 (RecB family)